MDPNETLRLIDRANRGSDALEECYFLEEWLKNKGYEPDWSKYPRGTRRYDRYIANTYM